MHRAALAGVEHQHRHGDVHLEVRRIVEHDLGRLAAQFEEHALQRSGALLHDALADAGRAGERDQVDARIGHQHFAGQRRIGTEHHVDHAIGETGFLGQFTEDRAHARRIRRGLEDDGAAGQQRGNDLADVDVERHVPRGDRPDDPDRFTQAEALMDHAEGGLFAVVEFPFDLVEHDHVVVPAVEGHVDVGAVHSTERGACFMHGQFAETRAVLLEQLAVLLHQRHALFGVGRPVGGVEGLARSSNRRIDVLGRGIGRLAYGLAGPWADNVESTAAGCIAQLAVDVELGIWKGGHRLILGKCRNQIGYRMALRACGRRW